MSGPEPPITNPGDDLPNEAPLAPTEEQRNAAIQWDAFSAVALKEVAESAKATKEGLASIITTAAAGLFLINLPDISVIDTGWKAVGVGIAFIATASGLFGIWQSLEATAGTPTHITREDFRTRYGSVDEFHRKRISDVAARLRTARIAVIVSVIAIVIGATVLAFAPSNGPQLSVQTADATYCGTLKSGDQGEIRLAIKGERDVRAIKFADVLNLRVSADCG